MKSRIIEQLGQTDILLPSLIADGLAANDRVKVRMSILQAASQHARDPSGTPIDLTAECRTAGIDASAIRSLVGGAHAAANGLISAPGLAELKQDIVNDVKAMIGAVAAGNPVDGRDAAEQLSSLLPSDLLGPSDDIKAGEIAALTGVSGSGKGTLHRLVMDLHKALNRLAAGCAEERIAGAHAYGLAADDRPIVAAFMGGVDRTRALKFDHPGLETTAIRSGARLTLQNDIGTTDAHVVVISVDGNAVTLTYTDVHRARAKFFTGLLNELPVAWSGLDSRRAKDLDEDGAFYLITGRLEGASTEERNAFLEAIGAALVFLIDWNKARKVLRLWVSKDDSIRILDWAARNQVGHRAFLELGGTDLVAAAVRHATPTRIGFGERLDSALGRDAAVDFLKSVLRISTEALLQGQSMRLARDRIEAELVRHLERVDSALLATVVRQTGLAREIAAAIERHIADWQSGRPINGAALAARARHIEEKADRIAIEARGEIARLEAEPIIEQLVNRAEEAIDELEQAAFVASLLPAGIEASLIKPLAGLCALAISAAEASSSGVEAAADVPEGKRADSEDALACVSRLIDLEHMADALERQVTAVVLRGGVDITTSLSVLELARAIERSTDRLSGFGHSLRQYVLADLST
jgi:uncharacterized protein Yka (UPF0111/DUF47 family)